MIKGHLNQQRANLNSTKQKPALSLPPPEVPPFPSSTSGPNLSDSALDTLHNFRPLITDPPDTRTHHIYADFASPTGQIFSDLTGRFLQPSSRGKLRHAGNL